MAKKQEEQSQAPARRNELALLKDDTVNKVAKRVENMIESGELAMPPGYSVGNAVTSWWLKLQDTKTKDDKPVLEHCTRNSIANATLDMLVQGLNPAKAQCYPIAYGKQLVCQRGYAGSMAVVKYIYGQGTQFWSEVVYKEDKLAYKIVRGRKMVTDHVQRLENVDNEKIVAAYAIVEPEKEGVEPVCEVMPYDKIKRSWKQGQTKGESPAHKGFPDEMSKRTVINRACKLLINTADDSHLVAKHAKRQDQVLAEAELEEEMEEGANNELLGLAGDEPPEDIEAGAAEGEGEGEAGPKAAEGEKPKEGEAPQQTKLEDPGF